ncbi:glycosyltransferase [Mucilaginibacter terrenus]|uniref:Glycosyltransferase n=1 Tax=Mucilaginibacter terrenus TaxID=2482727 RepID=A0A3E2NXK4_9SPHI|nr:WecB/TagA/CpsF family glycosyltransferase [Mucilaginibacter terrenus]RFZ85754.1 glycosyltransferase [Mucilaginibacter terrenus]
MAKNSTLNLFEYPIFTSTLDQVEVDNKSKYVINTLNQYSYIIAEKNPAFKKVLLESDILLPDGVGIVGAVKILLGKKIKKIAGADLHSYMLNIMNLKGGKCFYLGSSVETLEGIRNRLSVEYPNIQVELHSPPFKDNFTEEDNSDMIKHINAFKPDVLFVGMTAPKQETWVYHNKHKLDVKVICSIGAVFDFYSETVKRPGKFWINLGLEWFIRLLNEPNHLWKRYLLYGPVFVHKVGKEKFSLMLKGKAYLGDK